MAQSRTSFTLGATIKDYVLGDLSTCGSITVEKQTEPEGSPQTFDFTLLPDPNSEGTQSLADDGIFIWDKLVPNTYVLSEDIPSGWNLDDIQCTSSSQTPDITINKTNGTATIGLSFSEDVKCTYYDSQHGTIIVKKITDPSPDLTTEFTFTGDAAGSIKDGGTIIVGDLKPGTYYSTEAVPGNFDLTDITCNDSNSTGDLATKKATFNLEAGETVTCTFTNTKQGTIIVKKIMVGGTDTFSYAGTPNGSIGVDGGTIQATVVPGQYISTETVPAGWDLTSVVCSDANSVGSVPNKNATFNAEAGEIVTCTFTNTKLPTGEGCTPGFWKNHTDA